MPRITLPISRGFYVSDSLPLSSQRCVNFYPNIPQTSALSVDNLFGTPGVIEATPGINNVFCRGAHVLNGVAYFVIGDTLYRQLLTVSGGVDLFSLVPLGTIQGSDFVYMDNNGTQLCIVAAPDSSTLGRSYIFTADPDTLTEIVDPNFDGPAIGMAYISGYFVFVAASGKKFFNSPLNDGLGAYDPLDFNTAEADPDQIVGVIDYRGQAYVLGSKTVQKFRDIGRAPSPFAPITSATISVGVSAPHSVQSYADSIAFVGAGRNETPAVWIVNGSGKQKISTTAIDNVLSDLSEQSLRNIVAWSYSEDGAYFYGITLPTTTFVYDVSNKRWHERSSIDGVNNSAYRSAFMIEAYGRVIVGDLQDGRTGILDRRTYLEYGRLVRRFVTSQPFDNDGSPVFTSSIEAVVESGVGLSNDVQIDTGEDLMGNTLMGEGGSDPQINLSWSDDGGRRFAGNLPRSMGRIGEHNQRPIWRRIGRFPLARTLKLEVSSPTKATIIKVVADIA